MIGPKGYAAGLSALTLGAACLLPVAGQSQDGGLVFGFTVGEQLRHEDGETAARTDLGLTFNTQTRSQRLRFDLRSGFEAPLSDGLSDFNDVDPRFNLDYALESRDTLLEFDAAYSRADLDDLQFLEIVPDPIFPDDTEILVIDDGQREDLNAGLRLTLGRTAPIGATLALRNSETNYLGGSTATDSQSTSGLVRLRFNLTRTTTAFVDVSASELEREGNAEDVERRSVGTSLDMQVTPALVARLSLGESRVETDDGVTRTVQEGATYGLGLTANRPNGTIGGQLNSDITEFGRRTSFRLSRALELPRGSLRGAVGVSRSDETGNTDPIYDLSYTHDLPRGAFTANLSQRVSSTTDGAETVASRLQLSLRQDLTEMSSLSARLNLSENSQTASTGTDSTQYGVSVQYDHQLTRDWSLFGGVNYTRREVDGGPDTTDETVFIGLRSVFEWRP